MEAGSYDAPQVTAEDRDPPPTRSGREGRATPAKAEDHQSRPQVSGGVDGVAKQINCSGTKGRGSFNSPRQKFGLVRKLVETLSALKP